MRLRHGLGVELFQRVQQAPCTPRLLVQDPQAGEWEVIIELGRLMWTIAVVGESVIDIFDCGRGMGDFQDINGVGAVDRAMVNLEENDALVMGAPPRAPSATNTQTATPRASSVTEVTPWPTIAALNDDSSAMDLSNALDGVDGAPIILQNLATGRKTPHDPRIG